MINMFAKILNIILDYIRSLFSGSPTTIQLIAAKNPLKSQVLVGFFVILSPSCWHYRYRFFLFTNLWTILLYNWHKFIRFLHFLLLHLHRVRKRCVFDGWSYNLLNVVQSWKRTMKFAMLSIPMMWKATIRKAFAAISLYARHSPKIKFP